MNVSEDETHCLTVCSRGILKSTDIHSQRPISSTEQLINYDFTLKNPVTGNVTIYVCSTALPQFWNILPQMKIPIVLVTGDCDIDVPTDLFASLEEMNAIIDHPNLIHWFTQNCTYRHPKITAIPIGLDYHTMSAGDHHWGKQKTPVQQENEWKSIAQTLSPIQERKLKCYANFQFLMNTRYGFHRKNAIAEVDPKLVYYEPKHTTREVGWKKQGEYAFVLSPPGNGYDCHRTWEALCLGCIPIVYDTPINHVYEGLPVWIVKSWKDITEENMKQKVQEYHTTQYQWERMRLEYWIHRMKTVNAYADMNK